MIALLPLILTASFLRWLDQGGKIVFPWEDGLSFCQDIVLSAANYQNISDSNCNIK
jgi:hypothetical protein